MVEGMMGRKCREKEGDVEEDISIAMEAMEAIERRSGGGVKIFIYLFSPSTAVSTPLRRSISRIRLSRELFWSREEGRQPESGPRGIPSLI